MVVNFWASWCVPCRTELPLLDEMADRSDPDRVAVIGLNDDAVPSMARAFLDGLGGVGFPMAEGGGRLREQYGYRGLPCTVVLDGQGRIIKAFYGFGSSIEPVAAVVRSELEEAVPQGWTASIIPGTSPSARRSPARHARAA